MAYIRTNFSVKAQEKKVEVRAEHTSFLQSPGTKLLMLHDWEVFSEPMILCVDATDGHSLNNLSVSKFCDWCREHIA